VYKRWAAFGLLSSHSRLHGSSSYRVPWAYDQEAVDVLAKFTKLKCSLMPYLYGAAHQAHEHGWPMLRGMLLEFPDDPACAYLDLQYMLGDSLLVAPVFSHDCVVNYYVPAGRWTSLLDGKVIEGPRWMRETHDYMSLPLLVRPNSVLPVGSNTERPDYDYSEDVTLRIYELESGKRVQAEIPSTEGNIATRFDIWREGDNLHIKRTGESKSWQILLVNIHSAESNTDVNPTPDGVLLSPKSSVDAIEIKIT
jgi:alpha-D-xyloside xylohydrolase